MNVSITSRPPSERLRPFVRRLVTVEFHSDLTDLHLPDTGMVAAFRLQGECVLEDGSSAPNAALSGLWETRRTHFHSAGSKVAIVGFTPLGASAMLRGPLVEFANRTVDLQAVTNWSSSLSDRLVEADDIERERILEGFFLDLADAPTFDPLVVAAVRRIERLETNLRMRDLADWIGLSQSALERRFQRSVGTSPKRFASLVRLQRALRLQATSPDFARLALDAGYYDQSHFNKDFRRFTGQSPEAYFGPIR